MEQRAQILQALDAGSYQVSISNGLHDEFAPVCGLQFDDECMHIPRAVLEWHSMLNDMLYLCSMKILCWPTMCKMLTGMPLQTSSGC